MLLFLVRQAGSDASASSSHPRPSCKWRIPASLWPCSPFPVIRRPPIDFRRNTHHVANSIAGAITRRSGLPESDRLSQVNELAQSSYTPGPDASLFTAPDARKSVLPTPSWRAYPVSSHRRPLRSMHIAQRGSADPCFPTLHAARAKALPWRRPSLHISTSYTAYSTGH